MDRQARTRDTMLVKIREMVAGGRGKKVYSKDDRKSNWLAAVDFSLPWKSPGLRRPILFSLRSSWLRFLRVAMASRGNSFRWFRPTFKRSRSLHNTYFLLHLSLCKGSQEKKLLQTTTCTVYNYLAKKTVWLAAAKRAKGNLQLK